MQAHGDDRDWLEELDVFDHPNAPATEVFINPFRCDISPLEWQTLQQVWPPQRRLSAEGEATQPLSAFGRCLHLCQQCSACAGCLQWRRRS